MNAPPLYDLTPVLWLLLVGVTLAVFPVVWVWRRTSGSTRRLHALTVLALFLTFDLTLFGAFTRLSDSGLGCPDWPGCYGNASPVGARHEIAQAQAVRPTGPVTHGKAWVEMTHRYLATGVGALILVLTVATWLTHRKAVQGRRSRVRAFESSPLPRAGGSPNLKAPNPWWPTLTLAWICLQGAFGAWTVTWRLQPLIVTAHLLGAMVLLVLLCVQSLRYRQDVPRVAVSPGLRAWQWSAAGLLLGQIALGGWVSTNYAVLACNGFPQCQASWWPPMDFAQGFSLWRALGHGADGALLPFEALTAIHYAHRAMALLVFVVLGALAWRLQREPALRRPAQGLAVLLLLQALTGMGNVLLNWPLAVALLHTGGAAALMLVLTRIVCVSRVEARVRQPRPTVWIARRTSP